MGLRFRKSIGAGPFRVNFSKSGVGYSVGTKGYRVTKTAKGSIRKTASIPGTGVSYVTETSANKKAKTESRKTDASASNQTPPNGNTPKKHIFRNVIVGIFALFLISSIVSCGSDPKLESVSLTEISDKLDINDKTKVKFTISPDDFELDETSLKSSNEDVAKLYLENGTLYVETKKEGNAELWIEQDDVSSNKIKITVVDKEKQKKLEEEKKQAELKKQEEEKRKLEEQRKKEEQEKAEAAAQQQNQSSTQNNSQSNNDSSQSTNNVVNTPPVQNNSNVVYITGSGNGTKYHSNPNCSRMKNPIEISVSDAQARGYSPCSKCY